MTDTPDITDVTDMTDASNTGNEPADAAATGNASGASSTGSTDSTSNAGGIGSTNGASGASSASSASSASNASNASNASKTAEDSFDSSSVISAPAVTSAHLANANDESGTKSGANFGTNSDTNSDTQSAPIPPKRIVRLLAGFYLLLKGSCNILYLTLLSSFLQQSGAQNLPWVYLAVNISFVGFNLAVLPRLVGREGHWLLGCGTPAAMAFALFAAAAYGRVSAEVYLFALVGTMLLDLIAGQAFHLMTNQLLSLQEAKRHLTFVYASGSVGYILTGLMMKFAVDAIGFPGLLVLVAVFLLIGFFLLSCLRPAEQQRNQPQPSGSLTGPIVAEANSCRPTAFPPSWEQPLMRLLLVSSFLILFCKFVMDFLYSGAVATAFPDPGEMASFLGVFSAATDLTVILLQTFVMPHLFSLFSIGKILAFLPMILTVLALSTVLIPSFALIACLQFVLVLNSKTCTVPATTILLGALPQQTRLFSRRDIAVVSSVSSMLAGVALLFIRTSSSLPIVTLLSMVMFALLTIVHWRLDKAYAHTLQQTLAGGDLSSSEDWAHSLRYLPIDERLQRLRDLLAHPDFSHRKEAILEICHLRRRDVQELLLPRLALEEDPALLSLTARMLLERVGCDVLCHIELILADSENPRLTADLLEALSVVGRGEVLEGIVELFLHSDHHRVRASAVLSLLRMSTRRTTLEQALLVLVQLARSPVAFDRASAAAIMGEIGLPMFLGAVCALARDVDQMVATNALKSMVKFGTSRSLNALKQLAADPAYHAREAARIHLKNAGQDSLQRIAALLRGLSAKERHTLSRDLKGFSEDTSLELLGRILMLADAEARQGLMTLLRQGDGDLIRILDQVIISRQDTLSVSLTPIWQTVSQLWLQVMPVWSDALPFLASAPEREQGKEPNHDLSETLRQVWLEAIVLEEAAAQELPGFTGQRLQGLRESWRKRADIACRLAALTFPRPTSLLTAISQLRSQDAFTRSLAQELLESTFGPPLSRLLLPLIMPESHARLGDLAKQQHILPEEICQPEKQTTIIKFMQSLEFCP